MRYGQFGRNQAVEIIENGEPLIATARPADSELGGHSQVAYITAEVMSKTRDAQLGP
jgi:hypothetical protein